MTMEKVKSFIMDGRGGIVSLQVSTLITLFVMFYAGVQWKRDMEDLGKNRWSSVHMQIWAAQLASGNPDVAIPSIVRVIETVE